MEMLADTDTLIAQSLVKPDHGAAGHLGHEPFEQRPNPRFQQQGRPRSGYRQTWHIAGQQVKPQDLSLGWDQNITVMPSLTAWWDSSGNLLAGGRHRSRAGRRRRLQADRQAYRRGSDMRVPGI